MPALGNRPSQVSVLGARAANAGKKLLSGLRLQGECIWPGVPNDLYFAHRSIYRFFASFVDGHSVLDAGCGVGYGSMLLAESGARDVLGLDLDWMNIAYARRHFRRSNLSYLRGDCEELPVAGRRFGVIAASNMLEHLTHPEKFLERAVSALEPTGKFLFAIPAIVDESSFRQNQEIPYHRSNFFVDEWLELFRKLGFEVRLFAQSYGPGADLLDFGSPFPSSIRDEDFLFSPISRDSLYSSPCLGAIYELTRAELGTSERTHLS